jgi:hypothetical protein
MSRYLGFSHQGWARCVAAALVFGAFLIARQQRHTLPQAHGHTVEIELLLDNSPSMEVGATQGDIAAMMHLTPCSAPGVIYPLYDGRLDAPRLGRLAGVGHGRRVPRAALNGMSASGQSYQQYQCGLGADSRATSRVGGLDCPIPAARGVTGVAVMTPGVPPRCTAPPPSDIIGQHGTALAGAPCAFACHWDVRDPVAASHDYYGLARSTIGQPPCSNKNASPDACAITLRFDLVKNGVASLIDRMADATSRGLANLSIGIFTFDNTLHQIYPLPATCGDPGEPGCEAGQNWNLVRGAVGTAPILPNMPDGGIQPAGGFNGGMTNLPGALKQLAREYLNKAGNGTTPAAPKKALILVTDGMDDYVSDRKRRLGAIDPRLCDTYKSLGFAVFVIYTPYAPVMNGFYFANVARYVEGNSRGTIADALRHCASDPARNFIAADPLDPSSIATALQSFFDRAAKPVQAADGMSDEVRHSALPAG